MTGARYQIRVADRNFDDDIALHAAVHDGRGAGPCLVILHGWPSCSFEFDSVVEYLRADARASLKIVTVDLPGFGFSSKPRRPLGPRDMARLVRRALVEGLGIDRFSVHGNDWGSTVGSWLAFDHADVTSSAHLSMMGMRPALGAGSQSLAPSEAAWVKEVQKRLRADAGYREAQATKPTTLAVGLSDSPAALASWIVEKMHGWTGSDERADPLVAMENLAAIVVCYWISGNIDTANWVYTAGHQRDDTAAPQAPCPIPVGLSFFGRGFFPPPPAEWTERVYDVRFRRDHPTGGHYPALTEPRALADDLLAFLRQTAAG
jgi:pimeloyl-ACP methyl ester carboxylesterase